jgi:hypothetical protein
VTTQTHTITAAFRDRPAADAAADALAAAGVDREDITVTQNAAAETRYLWRLVVIIVLWSVLGGVVGALIGAVLYTAIGPEGTAGLVFQLVCWALIGHLIVGMVAGYWVLSDRTSREMEPDRGAWVLTARCSEEQAGLARGVLGRGA